MRAILLAGGQGTRLKPYTVTLPKPLMPLGGEMPIIEVILRQLARDGFTHVTVAVNHLARLIMAFCGDGSRWGLKLDYSIEDKPLSTIGPLTLIDDLPENFLVMNGDILCDLNYGSFLRQHIGSGSDLTVSVYPRQVKIDFGVLQLDRQGAITGFSEKPVEDFTVSMGIYGVSRRLIESLPRGEPYGFDNLMIDGIRDKRRLRAHRFSGYWLDIGRPSDYDEANTDFDRLRERWGL
jgi:NDP-sugar pyrophosphorylase family protein